MNPLETRHVEELSRLSDDEAPVEIEARDGVVSARSDRLSAVGVRFPSIDQFCDERVFFKLLKFRVRFQKRISIVEANDEPHHQKIVLHSIDKTSANRVPRKGISHRMDHH